LFGIQTYNPEFILLRQIKEVNRVNTVFFIEEALYFWRAFVNLGGYLHFKILSFR